MWQSNLRKRQYLMIGFISVNVVKDGRTVPTLINKNVICHIQEGPSDMMNGRINQTIIAIQYGDSTHSEEIIVTESIREIQRQMFPREKTFFEKLTDLWR